MTVGKFLWCAAKCIIRALGGLRGGLRGGLGGGRSSMLDLLVTGLGVDVVQTAVSDTNKAFPFDDNRLLIDKVVWDKQDAFVIRFDDKTATKLDVMEGVRVHVTGELVKQQRGVKVQGANLAIGRRVQELSILAFGVTKAAVDKAIRAAGGTVAGGSNAGHDEGMEEEEEEAEGAGAGGREGYVWMTAEVSWPGSKACVMGPGKAFKDIGQVAQCALLAGMEGVRDHVTGKLVKQQRGVKVQGASLAIARRVQELSILAFGVTKAAVDKAIRACKAEGVEGVFDVVNKEAGAGDGDAKEGEEDGFGRTEPSLYWVTDDVTLDGKSGCVIRPGVAFEGLGASKQCRLLGVFEATTEVLTERLKGLRKPGFKMDTSPHVMLESARKQLKQYVKIITKAVLLGVVETINQDIVQSQGSSSWQVHVEVGDVYKEGDPLLVAVVEKAKGGDIVSSIRGMDDKLKVMS